MNIESANIILYTTKGAIPVPDIFEWVEMASIAAMLWLLWDTRKWMLELQGQIETVSAKLSDLKATFR